MNKDQRIKELETELAITKAKLENITKSAIRVIKAYERLVKLKRY